VAHNKKSFGFVVYLETDWTVSMALSRWNFMQKSPKPHFDKNRTEYQEQRCAGLAKKYRFILGIGIPLGVEIIFLVLGNKSHFWTMLLAYLVLLILGLSMGFMFSGLWAKRAQPERLSLNRNPLHLAPIFLLAIAVRNREHIIGDLEEEYLTSNKRFPRLWYWG
jgi:hypothetical protein